MRRQFALLVFVGALVVAVGCKERREGPAIDGGDAAASGGAGTGGSSSPLDAATTSSGGHGLVGGMGTGGALTGSGGTTDGAAGSGGGMATGGAAGTVMGSGGLAATGGAAGSGMGTVVGSGGLAATGGAAGTVMGSGGRAASGGAAGRSTGGNGAPSTGGASGTPECAAGAHTCGGNTLLACDTNGKWPTQGTACDYVCRNNACAGECKPGLSSCKGNTLLTCDAGGAWPTTGLTCSPGFTCNAAQATCVCNFTKCADGRCIDTTADPTNCGSCGTACPGTCAASACQCVTQSSSNLVANGGFDTSLAGWGMPSPDVAVSRAAQDAAKCSTSGSLLLKDTSNLVNQSVFGAVTGCIPVTAGKAYNLGAWVQVPSQTPQPGAYVEIVWYSDTSCIYGTPSLSMANVVLDAATVYDRWQYLHQDNFAAPPGSAAMALGLVVSRGTTGARALLQAYFDDVYFTPAPGRF